MPGRKGLLHEFREWTRMDANGREWTRMDANGREWTRMDANASGPVSRALPSAATSGGRRASHRLIRMSKNSAGTTDRHRSGAQASGI
jgi:hypothetical protein